MQFHWDPIAGCPSEMEVVAELERLLGGPLAERGGRRLDVSARVHHGPDGIFSARVQPSGDGVTTPGRTVTNTDCGALARGAAHIAAVIIETVAEEARAGERPGTATSTPVETSEPPPSPPPAPAPPPTVAPPAPAPRVPSQTPRQRGALRGALRFSSGLGIGDLPTPVAVLRATAALLWRNLRLELEVDYEPLARIRSNTKRDRLANMQYIAGAVRGCPIVRRGRFEWPLCAGIEAGAVAGSTRNFAEDAEGTVMLVAVHAAPTIFYTLHPSVAVGVVVEGSLRLLRPQVIIADYGQIYRPALAVARVLATIEIRFPRRTAVGPGTKFRKVP